MKSENLITVAVKENKPELITSNPNFDATKLKTDGCGIVYAINHSCKGLRCFDCPFSNMSNRNIQSMKKWLKIE